MYFSAQFWNFEIFTFVKGGCLWDFFNYLNSQATRHLLSFFMPSILVFHRSEDESKDIVSHKLTLAYIHLKEASS